MKPQPTAATISFIPMPTGHELPVVTFEYDWRQQSGTFKLTSRIVVGKARQPRALLNVKAAA